VQADLAPTTLRGHAVLVGWGRVGSLIGPVLRAANTPLLVIEERDDMAEKLRAEGIEVITGHVGQRGLLEAANLSEARWLLSAIPNPFEASNLIEAARAANPQIRIVARAHSDAEVEHLSRRGADHVVMGEREIAREMAAYVTGLAAAVPGAPNPAGVPVSAPAPAPAPA
jgi:CPA2 family monovalent cation:H+ antiporter-2